MDSEDHGRAATARRAPEEAWRRFACDAEVARCEEASAAVAAEVTALAEADVSPHASLSGAAGWALLLHHAARRGLADPAAGERLVRGVMAELPRQGMVPGLISGFTGIAWLRAHTDPATASKALATIETRLVERLRRPWRREDDLLYGLVGFGAHFADRLPDPRAHEGLGLVVRRLDDLAERRDDGTIRWVSRSRMRTEPDEPPRYDLGVAHGVPGTIGLLATAAAADAEAALARELLEGAVSWVLGERRAPGWGEGATFVGGSLPFYLGGWEDEPRPSRLAWCYGDASAALMLLHAAEVLEREDWRSSAVELARNAARRDPTSAGVFDAGLCHGSAGVALVFARLAAYEDDAELWAAASTWLDDTLDRWEPGTGCGGFTVLIEKDWLADPSFLMGAAGIGLGLLALSDPEPPTWDRLLLLAPPGR